MMIKRFILSLLFSLIFTGIAFAQSGDQSASDKPALMEATTTTLTATVEAVDMEKREVTLKGKDGNSVTIDVSDDALALSIGTEGNQFEFTDEESGNSI